jgi:hypothetical protein
VRLFDDERTFAFANPAAVLSPGAEAHRPRAAARVEALVRRAAVIGAEDQPGGFTILGELRADGLNAPKDRDFALFLGPLVVTPDELAADGFDWERAIAWAGANTHLRAGDVVAAPPVQRAELDVGPFELAVDGIGTLAGRLA